MSRGKIVKEVVKGVVKYVRQGKSGLTKSTRASAKSKIQANRIAKEKAASIGEMKKSVAWQLFKKAYSRLTEAEKRIYKQEVAKRWREANPQKSKEGYTSWKKRNPKRVKEGHRKWGQRNREKVNEKNRRWREKNPEKYKESYRKSNLKRKGLLSSYLERYGQEDSIYTTIREERAKLKAKRAREKKSIEEYERTSKPQRGP